MSRLSHARRLRTRLAVVLAVLGVGSCTNETPEVDMPRVEFGQCAAVLQGSRCVLPSDRRLALWVGAQRFELRVEPGSRPVEIERNSLVSGGRHIEVVMTENASALTLITPGGTWRLALASDEPVPEIEAAAAFDPEDAEAGLRDVIADRPELAGTALSTMARSRLGRGDFEGGLATLDQAVSAFLAEGRSLQAARDASALAYYLVHRERRFAAADEVLARVADSSPASADAHYLLDYYRGLVAFNSGDARRALPLLRRAEEQSVRMGWARRVFHAQQIRAVQLQMLGRRAEALALLARWPEGDLQSFPPCERAMFANNRAWSALLVLEAGEQVEASATLQPGSILSRALPLMDEHCPVDEKVNLRINLALAAYHAGNYVDASKYLDQARALTPSPQPRMRLWSLDLEARLALAAGQVENAAIAYDHLQRLADATLSPDAAWRAGLGRARLLAATDQREEALRAFEDADALMDREMLRIPLHEGRESFLAMRRSAVREHMELLLDLGKNDRAFSLFRREGLRTMRGISIDDRLGALDEDQLAQWQAAVGEYRRVREELAQTVEAIWVVPRDQLQPLESRRVELSRRLKTVLDSAATALGRNTLPLPISLPTAGELQLAIARLRSDWAVFARTSEGLSVVRVECSEVTGPELAACWLEAVSAPLASARWIRFFSGRDAASVDLHAARVGAGRLLDVGPVVYAADLPAVSEASAAGSALLLADPSGSLGAARDEVAAVGEILAASAWQRRELDSAAATPIALAQMLSETDLFHFAGHARVHGTLGWDSALRFARDAEFAIGDILSLPRAPRFVVLSGCETGARSTNDREVAGIGLAHAFLARGASTVLAATRPVRDETARDLMTDFYRAWTSGIAAPEALRSAQLALRQADPEADWAAFRLFVR